MAHRRPGYRPLVSTRGPYARPARKQDGPASPHARRGGGCRRRAGADASIQHAEQAVQLLTGDRVARLDGDGALKLADGLAHLVLAHVDAREVEEREMARLIARRGFGALQPLDGFLRTAQLDEVCANVVVGIAEGGIDGDRALALDDGLLVLALVGERPAAERVRLRGGVNSERAIIALDGFVETPRHLRFVAALEVLARVVRPLGLGHDRSSRTNCTAAPRYTSTHDTVD